MVCRDHARGARRRHCGGRARRAPPPPAPAGPLELLKSRSYLGLLVLGAALGVVVCVVAYFFLKGVDEAQEYLFTTLPDDLGFDGAPVWWPLPLLALGGLLVALTIRYLPGTGGHMPAEGFKPSGAVPPVELPGIIIAAFATLSLRGGARARSSAHCDRQRHGRPGGASGPAKRSANRDRGDRGSRQLRGDQHPLRLSAHRSLPAHGGVRDRGRDARSRARTGPARRGHRRAHLRRAGLVDRLRDLLARGPRHSDVHDAGRSRVLLGGRDRARRCGPRKRHSTVGLAAPARRRAQDVVADAGRRNRGRRLGDRLR